MRHDRLAHPVRQEATAHGIFQAFKYCQFADFLQEIVPERGWALEYFVNQIRAVGEQADNVLNIRISQW